MRVLQMKWVVALVDWFSDWWGWFVKALLFIVLVVLYLLVMIALPMAVFGAELTLGELVALAIWVILWLAIGMAALLTFSDRA